jgi:hypothetical protein
VDSKKFDIAVATTNTGYHRSDVEPVRQNSKSAIWAAEKAGLQYAQLIDQIVRQGMKTVRD